MADNHSSKTESTEDLTVSRVDLTTSLYQELRKLAAARMANQAGPQTLQATALVHEAWLRLGGENQPNWENRAHFFASVAEVMRNILVDRARRRKRIRHGGKLHRVDLETTGSEGMNAISAARDDEFITLHEALERLEAIDPEPANLLKLRYFAGLTIPELAEATDLSRRTTERRLAYARSWLGSEMQDAMKA
ncbi:MAG: ECF-type sigma factor [Puniceicoccaceae bacterium]